MTRKEAVRINEQTDRLCNLGFTIAEAEQLRRISMTLRRWYELECGDDSGCIERDETTGKALRRSAHSGKAWKIPDREKGALKRLAAILERRNSNPGEVCIEAPLSTYIQTDPRGAALYILRPGDVPEGEDPSSCYSRGICVY